MVFAIPCVSRDVNLLLWLVLVLFVIDLLCATILVKYLYVVGQVIHHISFLKFYFKLI